ncbi:MAG: hypothetical protein CR991_02950 [Proteobacteria bacterium]|nr:MAG: hypothetical protein CR991_02950 [Pseudomonadota bacterium]
MGLFNKFYFIKTAHFTHQKGIQSRELFRRSVNFVEIEVFSYCNRVCWFCPNSFIDRRSANIYMIESVYLSILNDLASIKYAGTISYSRYNEPLSDKVIIERIKQARAALPSAILHTNTNGDYLDSDYLDALSKAGLNSLNIQVYLANHERYDHEKMKKIMKKLHKRLGISVPLAKDKQNEWLEARFDWKGIKIRHYARNFEINGCNRGDTVPIDQHYQRNTPCFSPFRHLYIDYNGKVMPCCNLRSDIETHQTAIIGELSSETNIFDLYAGMRLSQWRSALVDFSAKSGFCKTCSFNKVKPSLLNRYFSSRATRKRDMKNDSV